MLRLTSLATVVLFCNAFVYGQTGNIAPSPYQFTSPPYGVVPKAADTPYQDQSVKSLIEARENLEKKLLEEYKKLEVAQFDRTINNSEEIHQVICKLIDLKSIHATELCIKNIDNPHSINPFAKMGMEPSEYMRHLYGNRYDSLFSMIRYTEQTKMSSDKHDTYVFYAARLVAGICKYDRKRIERFKYVLLDEFKQPLVDAIVLKAAEMKEFGR